MKKKLYRLPEQGKISGVAAGFAEYFDMDVTLMRLLFVAALFVTAGAAVVAYIVLAIVMPTPGTDKNQPIDVSDRVENLAEEMKANGRAQSAGNYIGLGLILLGVWLLAGRLFPGWFSVQWNLVWPAVIIVLGVWIILKGKRS